MKSQLLINHRFMLIKQKIAQIEERGKIKLPSGNIPVFLGISHQFLFLCHQRALLEADAGVSGKAGDPDHAGHPPNTQRGGYRVTAVQMRKGLHSF